MNNNMMIKFWVGLSTTKYLFTPIQNLKLEERKVKFKNAAFQ